VIVRVIGQEERERVARHDLPQQDPHQRPDVRELRRPIERARETAHREQLVVENDLIQFHNGLEERNRGQTRTARGFPPRPVHS
jgi:hypothetical protein